VLGDQPRVFFKLAPDTFCRLGNNEKRKKYDSVEMLNEKHTLKGVSPPPLWFP
jgi:hypothetical protein